MAKKNINSILGGISYSYFYGQEGSYTGASGIDPEKKINNRISGAINPVFYEKVLDIENILWLEPNDKNNLIYYYTADGKFGSISGESYNEVHEFSNSSGNGLVYYNNYYYIATDKDIHRYGPMDGSPSIESNWWTKILGEESLLIDATGDTAELGYTGYDKVLQSINDPVSFEKVTISLKNTGTDIDYNIVVKVVELEDTRTDVSLGGDFSNVDYSIEDIKSPEVSLGSATIPASDLSGESEEHDFEFASRVVITEGRHAVIVEPESEFTEGQSFEVITSDVGDTYSAGMFMFNDGSWDRDNPITYDTETGSFTFPADGRVFHSWTVSTIDEEPLSVSTYFRASIDTTTQTSVTLYRNRDGDQTQLKLWLVTGSGGALDLTYTIASGTLEHGDILELNVDQADDNDRTISRQTGYPYFWFSDPGKEVDMSVQLIDASLEFAQFTDIKYPKVGDFNIPNHSMHLHSNNAVYFCAINGVGALNKISTGDNLKINMTSGTIAIGDMIEGVQSRAIAEVGIIEEIPGTTEQNVTLMGVVGSFVEDEEFTVLGTDKEGTVNSEIEIGKNNLFSEGSVLKFPIGSVPVDIASIDTDIGVITINTKEGIDNGRATLFLWDTFDRSFYRQVRLPFRMATAIYTQNGKPYVFGGDEHGYSLSVYTGGREVQNIAFIDNGFLPLAGAVDAVQDRILFGCSQEYPQDGGCVLSFGSKTGITKGIHNIISVENQVTSIIYAKDGILVANQDGVFNEF